MKQLNNPLQNEWEYTEGKTEMMRWTSFAQDLLLRNNIDLCMLSFCVHLVYSFHVFNSFLVQITSVVKFLFELFKDLVTKLFATNKRK